MRRFGTVVCRNSIALHVSSTSFCNLPSRAFGTQKRKDRKSNNGSSKDPLKLAAREQMDKYKMDGKKCLKIMEPLWDNIVSMAKNGAKQEIKATLRTDCDFRATRAGLMAQWFINNCKSHNVNIDQSGMYYV